MCTRTNMHSVQQTRRHGLDLGTRRLEITPSAQDPPCLRPCLYLAKDRQAMEGLVSHGLLVRRQCPLLARGRVRGKDAALHPSNPCPSLALFRLLSKATQTLVTRKSCWYSLGVHNVRILTHAVSFSVFLDLVELLAWASCLCTSSRVSQSLSLASDAP